MIREKDPDEIRKFLSRAQRMAQTEFPSDTEELVVIKGKGDGYGYIEDFKKLDQVYFLERESVLQVIRKINKEIHAAYSQKRNLEDMNLVEKYTYYGKMLALVQVIGLIILIVAEVGQMSESASTVIASLGLVVLILGSILACSYGVFIMYDKVQAKDLTQEIADIVERNLLKFNEERVGVGSSMKADPQMRWIEVWSPKGKVGSTRLTHQSNNLKSD